MRSSIVLPLVAALSLAACQQEKAVVAKDESAEAVAKKVAAANLKPQPGRWEAQVKINALEVPNMPPEAREMMKNQMNVTQTTSSCLTPEEADKPEAGFFQKGAENCKYDRFAMAGGKIDAKMTCNDASGTTAMTMTGTYTPTHYDLQIKSQGEMQKGMPMSLDMSVAADHVGACNGSEDT